MSAMYSVRASIFLAAVLLPFATSAAATPVDDEINALFERARRESAAGQIRAPAGDNLMETIDKIISLISQASPETLDRMKDLAALIEQSSSQDTGVPALEATRQPSATAAPADSASGPGGDQQAIPSPPSTLAGRSAPLSMTSPTGSQPPPGLAHPAEADHAVTKDLAGQTSDTPAGPTTPGE